VFCSTGKETFLTDSPQPNRHRSVAQKCKFFRPAYLIRE